MDPGARRRRRSGAPAPPGRRSAPRGRSRPGSAARPRRRGGRSPASAPSAPPLGHEVRQQAPGPSCPTSPGGTGHPTACPVRQGRHRPAVVAHGHGLRADRRREGVDEVDPGPRAQALEQGGHARVTAAASSMVPLHLRVLHPGRQRRDLAGEHAEARRPPDSPPTPRRAAGSRRTRRRTAPRPRCAVRAGASSPLSRSARAQAPKAPDARAAPPRRPPRPRPVGDEPGRRADVLQRLLGRAQVADAVVEDGDPRPAVTGSPWWRGCHLPRSRTASRRQRATPLKLASSMWCVFFPSSRRMCSVMLAAVTKARQNSSASCGSNGGEPRPGVSGAKSRP